MRSKSMDWFLYDNGLRHERVNISNFEVAERFFKMMLLVLNLYLYLQAKFSLLFINS